MKNLKIFSGSSHPNLAERICKNLGVKLSKINIQKYGTGCFEIVLGENVRGCKVFIIQTSIPDFNTLHWQLWELFEMIQAASKASALEVNVVFLYNSYARSDRKWTGRMPITGKILAEFLEAVGIDRYLGVELHSEYEGFFSSKTKIDHLRIYPLIIDFLKTKNLSKSFILPADHGARKRFTPVFDKLNLPCGDVKKRRIGPNKVIIDSIEGDIEGKDIFLLDDEICEATTVMEIGKVLEKMKAKSLTIIAAHGLFTGRAVENLRCLKILKQVAITDTVPVKDEIKKQLPIVILPIDKLIARAIKEIYQQGSVSQLFQIN